MDLIKIVTLSMAFSLLSATTIDALAVVRHGHTSVHTTSTGHTNVRHTSVGHTNVGYTTARHTTTVGHTTVGHTNMQRIWVPGHYYNGTWVAGTHLNVNCVHWKAGRYSKGRWVNGYCAD